MKKQEGYTVALVAAVAVVGILTMLAQTGFDSRILGEAFKTMNKIDVLVDVSEEATIPCVDGDGGKDLATASYVTGPLTKDSASAVTMEDFCKTDNEIIEYVCTDERYAPEWDGVAAAWAHDCPCEEGRCTDVIKVEKPMIAMTTQVSGLFGTSETVSIQTPTNTYDCEDSDGGSNYYKKGTVTKSYRDGSVETLQDSCYTDDIRLAEFYCNGDGEMVYDIVKCDGSCDAGACVLSKFSLTK